MGCAGKSGYIFSRFEVPPTGACEFIDGFRPGPGAAIHCGVSLLGGFDDRDAMAQSEIIRRLSDVCGEAVEAHLVYCGRAELLRRAAARRHDGLSTTGHSVPNGYGFGSVRRYGEAHDNLRRALSSLGWKVTLIHSFRDRYYATSERRFRRIVGEGEAAMDAAAARLGLLRPVAIRGRPVGKGIT